MELLGRIHHHEVNKMFDNGKPRKKPRVQDWEEEVVVLAFVALANGEVKAVVRTSGGGVKTTPLSEGHLYGDRLSGQRLTIDPPDA